MLKLRFFLKVFLCLTLAFSLIAASACSLVPTEDDGSQTDAASAFTEEELATTVIQIGDFTVDLNEYLDLFNEVADYYYTYGYDITATDEDLESYKSIITNALIEENMLLYQASELGLDQLTDEQLAEIEDTYQEDITSIFDYYTQLAKNEVKDPNDLEAINELVEQYIVDEAEYYLGAGATKEEYFEYLEQSAHDQYVVNLLKEYVTADIVISDESITEEYDYVLTDPETGDKFYYADYPEAYRSEQENYELTGTLSDGTTTIPPLYIPEGYSRILHIYTTSDAEFSEEYTQNIATMTKLESEYGKLALKDAASGTNANANRIKEILDEYRELKAANDAEYQEHMADARAKIEEAYAKLQNGEAFSDVMVEYTEDSIIMSNDVLSASGRLIAPSYYSEQDTDDFSDEVKAAFSELNIGEYSSIIEDDSGFHIIYYLSDVTPGIVPMEDVKDAIYDMLRAEQVEEVMSAQVAAWIEDSEDIVIINEELIAEVGKR